MSNNITTLILNLLISENRLHRARIADRIFELLENNVADFGETEKLIRKHFSKRIVAAVENPVGKTKDFLFEMANFYNDFYIGSRRDFLAQAA